MYQSRRSVLLMIKFNILSNSTETRKGAICFLTYSPLIDTRRETLIGFWEDRQLTLIIFCWKIEKQFRSLSLFQIRTSLLYSFLASNWGFCCKTISVNKSNYLRVQYNLLRLFDTKIISICSANVERGSENRFDRFEHFGFRAIFNNDRYLKPD
jgi:hypothetical protein